VPLKDAKKKTKREEDKFLKIFVTDNIYIVIEIIIILVLDNDYNIKLNN